MKTIAGLSLLFCAAQLAAQQSAKAQDVTIHIRDYCDPTTFDAAVGPGACVPLPGGRAARHLRASRRGVGPDHRLGRHPAAPRLVGQARALQMFVAAEKVSAGGALRIGLVDAVAEDPVAWAVEKLKQLAIST